MNIDIPYKRKQAMSINMKQNVNEKENAENMTLSSNCKIMYATTNTTKIFIYT